jgi:hypothetical protein
MDDAFEAAFTHAPIAMAIVEGEEEGKDLRANGRSRRCSPARTGRACAGRSTSSSAAPVIVRRAVRSSGG